MLSSNMLLPNLIPLIDVPFSTPTDEMRRPVSDGMLYAPRYPRARGTEKKETGNEEG
jgi:hypothetical protein